MIKYILACLVLWFSCSYSLADTPDASTCNKYLKLSSGEFEALLSNPQKAADIYNTLKICLKYNTCSTTQGIEQCAPTLGNRAFLSDFYANQVNAQSPAPTTSNPLLSAPSSPVSAAPPADTQPLNQNNPKPKNTKDSIHWF